MHRWMYKNTPDEGEQLQQYVSHMDHVASEVERLLPNLPGHKDLGIDEQAKLRFIAAAKHARNFTTQQMQKIIFKSQTYITYKLAKRRKEDANQVTDWVEEILESTVGYKKAHTWTRGTSKAPPLLTHMWRKGNGQHLV